MDGKSLLFRGGAWRNFVRMENSEDEKPKLLVHEKYQCEHFIVLFFGTFV
jgi:hypothetical protein